MFGHRTPLIIVERTMAGAIYVDNIIESIIHLCATNLGIISIYQDDNARPLRTRKVQNILQENNIQRMNCLANSPDINPIEDVWNCLGRAISNRQNLPSTFHELSLALQEEWNDMFENFIIDLIRGMPRLIGQLIERRGGNTDYRIWIQLWNNYSQ